MMLTNRQIPLSFAGLWIVFLFLFPFGNPLNCQVQDPGSDNWADSVLRMMSLDDKIAQLLMIRTYSNKNDAYYKNTEEIIRKYKPGGLCFFQGGPVLQAKLTNRYQSISRVPLFIAMDAEWGLGMRLDSTFSYPYQMTLGSMPNDSLVYQVGQQVARQLRSIGVHINFAPVIDINNNPLNPVINSRSFGSDRVNVARKGIAYMQGLQDGGIIATAKHFPGHGDTESDSHHTLPVIGQSRERLDSIELFPFRELIANGLEAVMVAHLFVPALDNSGKLPTSLSSKVINDLLKTELGFSGLVITDALDMKGATEGRKPGQIELEALLAGNDILLLPQDVEAAISTIRKAVEEGQIPEQVIHDRCKKILGFKYRAGLSRYKPVDIGAIRERLEDTGCDVLERQIYKDAIIVLHNHKDLIPLRKLDTLRLATVAAGSAEVTGFQEMLATYTHTDQFTLLASAGEAQQEILLQRLSGYNLVIVSVHNTSIFPSRKFNISSETIRFLDQLAAIKKVILVLFASPYSAQLMPDPERFEALMIGHQDTPASNALAAQIIMGGVGARGLMPVDLPGGIKAGGGVRTGFIGRLSYGLPEEVGIQSVYLSKIDSIVFRNIREEAFPGCQVLVAVDGQVIYNKAFGYHTYKKGEFVTPSSLYDLASVTKIAATTLGIMKLYDSGRLDIDYKLSWYLPYLNGTNKEDLVIRDIMTHQAGLQAWIPFYLNTLKKGKPDPAYYASRLDESHTVKVASDLYIDRNYSFVINDSIVKSKLRTKRDYKYSDLGFMLLKQAIENLTNRPLDQFLQDQFYKPLGLQYMCFNPLTTHNPREIVPTEVDDYFRFQLVHGYVHDPGAAMLGGVSGHAGLFSNASDLAVIMQMLLQGGYYGGERYLQSSTVSEFTKQQFPLNNNRRGLGFDKPEPENRDNGPTTRYASLQSFGHTGFTGTYAWADPKYELVYIFLSNRVHPSAKNNKLVRNNTRTQIMQVIYEALIKSGKYEISASTVGHLDLPAMPAP